MKTYITDYKVLFCLSWISMYLIFPTWALPDSVTARFFFFSGLIIFFSISTYVMNRYYNSLDVSEPLIYYPKDFFQQIKNNMGLVCICCIAVVLHMYPISNPVYLVGDEALFLHGGLWIYDYFGRFWYKIIQYTLWVLIGLSLVKAMKNRAGSSSKSGLSIDRTLNPMTALPLFSGALILVIFFFLLRNMPPNVVDIRYHPLYRFLYFISYCIVGINYVGPRMVQFIFYIFSAIYLYRTINLFYDRNTSLLGASIFLFSPVIFSYAHFAEIASGVVFFITFISYYFIRYITFSNNRDLLLSSSFISIGFLYKEDILLMFIAVLGYLFLHKIREKNFFQKMHFKIVMLSLVHIIPFLLMRKYFNWRGAWIDPHNFTSLNKITAYLLLIPSQVSWIVFSLFLMSLIFVFITKRNHLTLFYGFLFIAFYSLYTSQRLAVAVDRFAMAFYPTIAVFLSIFLSSIVYKIRWKHTFKLVFSFVTVYLILLCAVPSFSTQFITFKNIKEQYFPNGKSMKWVRDNVRDNEKILTLRFKPDLFYKDKYAIDRSKIISLWYELQEVSTPQKLRTFCIANKISYILFPYGPEFADNEIGSTVRNYLKENKDHEFEEVIKFKLEENYIYIYKLKYI